ncbi:hypothetical protein [Vibrio mangrovi]|uniref:Uncharacterized protein n=1 Tax=Vibrio mangrovi TaxID=474394 RepID=A0A1Y6IVZ9_9VIBR|nr:hypothetical protein [Vibrio mangrovi]MDW6004709.1 hypothetical protein [Vibrio mangrovi]SMS01000.1 hypothetical protein VIM7927_02277 [Vibrio mangrovi]
MADQTVSVDIGASTRVDFLVPRVFYQLEQQMKRLGRSNWNGRETGIRQNRNIDLPGSALAGAEAERYAQEPAVTFTGLSEEIFSTLQQSDMRLDTQALLSVTEQLLEQSVEQTDTLKNIRSDIARLPRLTEGRSTDVRKVNARNITNIHVTHLSDERSVGHSFSVPASKRGHQTLQQRRKSTGTKQPQTPQELSELPRKSGRTRVGSGIRNRRRQASGGGLSVGRILNRLGKFNPNLAQFDELVRDIYPDIDEVRIGGAASAPQYRRRGRRMTSRRMPGANRPKRFGSQTRRGGFSVGGIMRQLGRVNPHLAAVDAFVRDIYPEIDDVRIGGEVPQQQRAAQMKQSGSRQSPNRKGSRKGKTNRKTARKPSVRKQAVRNQPAGNQSTHSKTSGDKTGRHKAVASSASDTSSANKAPSAHEAPSANKAPNGKGHSGQKSASVRHQSVTRRRRPGSRMRRSGFSVGGAMRQLGRLDPRLATIDEIVRDIYPEIDDVRIGGQTTTTQRRSGQSQSSGRTNVSGRRSGTSRNSRRRNSMRRRRPGSRMRRGGFSVGGAMRQLGRLDPRLAAVDEIVRDIYPEIDDVRIGGRNTQQRRSGRSQSTARRQRPVQSRRRSPHQNRSRVRLGRNSGISRRVSSAPRVRRQLSTLRNVRKARIPGQRMLSRVGKAGRRFAPVKRLTKKIPYVGAALEALNIGSTLADQSLSRQEKASDIGGSLGSMGGAAVGATVGAAIGSVVPVIGTAIGGMVGSYLGGIGGEWLGRWAGKSLFSDDKEKEKASAGAGMRDRENAVAGPGMSSPAAGSSPQDMMAMSNRVNQVQSSQQGGTQVSFAPVFHIQGDVDDQQISKLENMVMRLARQVEKMGGGPRSVSFADS